MTDALEAIGWEVSDQVGDSDDFDMPPIDEVAGSGEGIEAKAVDQLKGIADRNDKRALIQYVSHFGGHQYAGNVVVTRIRNRRANVLTRLTDIFSQWGGYLVW